jgi:glutamyl/glutaminyl-tRNA synthetase
LKLKEGKTAARIRVPESEPELRAAMGDFVVWRRGARPAYQLQSLIDDEEMGITHIVRGEDLADSTLAQRYLAGFISDSAFLKADIRQHRLITTDAGEKLSKSQGTSRLELTPELRTRLDQYTAAIRL